MSNKYLEFISDEDFFSCIEFLYHRYEEALMGIDYSKFFKNRIDTFKMTFDKEINNLSEQDWLASELQRQVDKTITNSIGIFHEKLIGSIQGYTAYPVGNKFDIANDDFTILAEIKNKHNTLTGTHVPSLFRKMQEYANEYPNATCYYVRIIDKVSQDRVWKFSSGGKVYSDDRIRIISGDKFYELITGREDAFKEVATAVPLALREWMDMQNVKQGSSMGLFSELYTRSVKNNRSLFEEITEINYDTSKYTGFSTLR